jgi:hypothetical protein
MLVHETILFLVALYLALVYCVLYLSFEAFPISFEEERGWTGGVGALPFLSLLVGFIISGIIITIQNYGGYAKQIREKGYAPPEARLPPMMIGAVSFPIGLFVRLSLLPTSDYKCADFIFAQWFGWTSSPNITWVPQVLAGVPRMYCSERSVPILAKFATFLYNFT